MLLASVKGTVSLNLIGGEAAKNLAVEHLFERSSVVRELHAAGMLLRRGIGWVSVEEASAFARTDARFVRLDPEGALVTTREVLAEESAMIETARAGQAEFEAIGRGEEWRILSPVVAQSKEQTKAAQQVLHSRDLVTAIHGPAGSGKTTLMREAVAAIETLSGKDVLVLAPSASAVQVLRDDGFANSETFQKFRADDVLQALAKGQILWVDEAGFLSVKEMNWLVQFADRNGCRLVLSGDTRQHHGVERGDALRVLRNSGAVTLAVLTGIIRQQNAVLRQAVIDLSHGRTEAAFDKLDTFGAIHEL